jgi:hypothetical protein
MKLVWTAHAEEAIRERFISRSWVIQTLEAPEWHEDDPFPGRKRLFRRIPEFGNRVLRVVYEDIGDERHIVTLFFDRKAGRET